MTHTTNKTELEKRIEKATIKINLKFLVYSPIIAAHLADDTEGRI